MTAEIPHGGVNRFWLLRTASHHGAAAGTVRSRQNFLPGLAAVVRLVNAALVVVIPQMPQGADQNVIAVGGVYQNLRNVLAVFQADVGPVLPAIRGFINAVADRNAVAHPGFAGSYPDSFRIRGIDRHGADGLHIFPVEYRLVGRTSVDRLPNSAAGRSNEHGDPAVFFHRVHGGDAAAHGSRADVARRQSRNCGGVEAIRRLRLQGRACARGEERHGYCPRFTSGKFHDSNPFRVGKFVELGGVAQLSERRPIPISFRPSAKTAAKRSPRDRWECSLQISAP